MQYLRQSSRLAGWVLLVFAMKVGVSIACVGHDMADLGLVTGGEHTEQHDEAPGAGGGDDAPTTGAGHNGCSHAATHQATTLTGQPSTVVLKSPGALEPAEPLALFSAPLQDQLRPPIA